MAFFKVLDLNHGVCRYAHDLIPRPSPQQDSSASAVVGHEPAVTRNSQASIGQNRGHSISMEREHLRRR